jgi:secreted trypsin-like serine protease
MDVAFSQSVQIPITNYSSVIDLKIKHYNTFKNCTGVFINPTIILTAGHCVYDSSPSDITIYVGFNSRKEVLWAKKIQVLPTFRDDLIDEDGNVNAEMNKQFEFQSNDLALIQIDGKVEQFNTPEVIFPVIPEMDELKNFILKTNTDVSSFKSKAQLNPIASSEDVLTPQNLSFFYRIGNGPRGNDSPDLFTGYFISHISMVSLLSKKETQNSILTSLNDNVARGDSGGPLLFMEPSANQKSVPKIAGITSGSAGANQSSWGYYTVASNHKKWIDIMVERFISSARGH